MKPRQLIGFATMTLAPFAGAVAAWATRVHSWVPRAPREHIHARHIPDVEIGTQDGKRVRFYEDLVKDRKVVINFMYTHCKGICSPVTSNLVKVQHMLGDRMGRDLFFYSISLEPA